MAVNELLARATRKLVVKGAAVGLERAAESVRQRGGEPLAVVLPNGSRIDFGKPPRVVLTVRDDATLASLAKPSLGTLGAAFVEGGIDIDGDMAEVVRIAESLSDAAGASVEARSNLNSSKHSTRVDRDAIQFHYDVGNAFYQLWLDPRMVYSCAYFRDPADSLEDAQFAKLDLICRKLRLRSGERFLDIGCGWGGLVLHAARYYGVAAVGITLSDGQYQLARERVAATGLADRVEILLLDYRELEACFGTEHFDKAASVGMFEHVGLRHLPEYFGIAARLVRPGGLFLNHGITSSDVENRPVGGGASQFIEQYIFPHGELPHLHLAVREMAAQGFEVCDVESLRRHYALTLSHWSRNLEARLDEARRTASERVLRAWRAYLAGCAHGFAHGWMNIYQLLGARPHADGRIDVPLTRDWLYR
jgi:cyclopropane-fatty-acyl-phospholipid synthase